MGSHHKRNEGLKPLRRMPAKPKPEKKHLQTAVLDPKAEAFLAIQQTFLDLLSHHFSPVLQDAEFEKKLQGIKGHFYHREYDKVFTNTELCVIYAIRYLPSRVLAYRELFQEECILDLLFPPPPPRRPSESRPVVKRKRTKVVAIGAGVGSELCALHLLAQTQRFGLTENDEDYLEVLEDAPHLEIVDSANYQVFLQDLESVLIQQGISNQTEPIHSYHQQNILEWASSPEFIEMLAETTLLTFMFVFNELFASSKVLTMKLIGTIAHNLPIGGHVLLIESAGDLSEVKLSSQSVSNTKQVRILETEEEKELATRKALMVYKFWDFLPGFERVWSEDRKWFRVDKTLHYSLELENVAYFVRLYRRTG